MVIDVELRGPEGHGLWRWKSAEGALSEVIALCQRSPWLKLDGATLTWTAEDDREREFEFTASRWRYVHLRAMRELWDPGVAERVAELVWAAGLDAVPSVVLVQDYGGRRNEYEMAVEVPIFGRRPIVHPIGAPWLFGREPVPAIYSARDLLERVARECPTEIQSDMPATGFRLSEELGRDHVVICPTCLGCGEAEKMTVSVDMVRGDGRRWVEEHVRRTMLAQHALCGAIHAEAILRRNPDRMYERVAHAAGTSIENVRSAVESIMRKVDYRTASMADLDAFARIAGMRR